MARFARLIASGLGAGFAPVAPGTVGSVLATLAGGAWLAGAPAGAAGWGLAAGSAAAALGGVWAVSAARLSGDPGWVVIDEIAGQWLALLPLALAWTLPLWAGLLLALALFRLFDIAKPGPVGWVDRHHGAVAVIGDDLAAGALAALALGLLGWAVPALLHLRRGMDMLAQ